MHKARLFHIAMLSIVLVCSCQSNETISPGKAKDEIAQAEKDFEQMAAEKGIAEAFFYFADSNAVIKRQNDTLIKGKENIRNFYSAGFYKDASVKWSPDFIEASGDGDFGYTFGKYIWQSKDSSGKLQEFTGIFHTVWKKQKDGSWKYVWD